MKYIYIPNIVSYWLQAGSRLNPAISGPPANPWKQASLNSGIWFKIVDLIFLEQKTSLNQLKK